MNRREFLQTSLIASAFPQIALGANDFWSKPRWLWLYRPSSKVEVKEVYWTTNGLNRGGYERICALLGDVREQKAVTMDIVLLDIMRGIQGWYEAQRQYKPIIINSGYRTLKTNSSLENAAKNSFHLKGRAVDYWIPGVSTEDLFKLSAYMRGGGVGFYPNKQFVHVDTGNLRYWKG